MSFSGVRSGVAIVTIVASLSWIRRTRHLAQYFGLERKHSAITCLVAGRIRARVAHVCPCVAMHCADVFFVICLS